MPPAMDWLLYFTSFVAVLALFASAIAVIVWCVRAAMRAWLRQPEPGPQSKSKSVAPAGKFAEDFSNPNHFKRAGQ